MHLLRKLTSLVWGRGGGVLDVARLEYKNKRERSILLKKAQLQNLSLRKILKKKIAEKMSSQFNFALLMLSVSISLPLPSSSLPHVPPADILQNVVVLCQEIQCPVLTCSHPIRIEGQCCPICLQPGMVMIFTVNYAEKNAGVKVIVVSACIYFYSLSLSLSLSLSRNPWHALHSCWETH